MRGGEDPDKLQEAIAGAVQSGAIRKQDASEIYQKGVEGKAEERWAILSGKNAIDVFVNHLSEEEQQKIVKMTAGVNQRSVLGKRRAEYAASLPEKERDTDPLLLKLDDIWDSILSKKSP